MNREGTLKLSNIISVIFSRFCLGFRGTNHYLKPNYDGFYHRSANKGGLLELLSVRYKTHGAKFSLCFSSLSLLRVKLGCQEPILLVFPSLPFQQKSPINYFILKMENII